MRRFFCEQISKTGETTSLSDMESHHLRDVLRAKTGMSIKLMNGKGTIATAEIIDTGGRRGLVTCSITDVQTFAAPPHRWHLFVAPPKGKLMQQIVRQATELGVSNITPIVTEHTESKPTKGVPESWQTAAVMAIKQAINPFLPTIEVPRPFSEVLSGTVPSGYVGWVPETGQADPPPEIDSTDISLFIGPEGGFSPTEVEQLLAIGIHPLSLGPWVLRVETAAIAGLSWLNQRYSS